MNRDAVGKNVMAKNGLKRMVQANWVDIGARKKVEVLKNVEENKRKMQKENIQNACLLQKLEV